MKTNFRYNRNSTFTRRRISYKNEATSKTIKIKSSSFKRKLIKSLQNLIEFITKFEGVIAFIFLINEPIISTLKKILMFLLLMINEISIS